MRRTTVTFDFTKLPNLADRLAGITDKTIGEPLVETVNVVAADTRNAALKVMLSSINLSSAYVEEKMILAKATSKPRATIVGLGATITNLERYYRNAGVQLTTPVRWPNDGTKPSGFNPRKPGYRLPWKPRVGAPRLGVPVGQKQAGLTLAVVKGRATVFPHSFTFTAKNGAELVGSRAKGDHRGKGKIQTKVGPSVYQMFNAALTPDFIKQVEESLSKLVLDGVAGRVRSALE